MSDEGMRSRKEIMDSLNTYRMPENEKILIELLLDIREHLEMIRRT